MNRARLASTKEHRPPDAARCRPGRPGASAGFGRIPAGTGTTLLILLGLLWCCSARAALAVDIADHLRFFAAIEDRSSGSPGADHAAEYIFQAFQQAGLSSIETQKFFLPLARLNSASITIAGASWPLYPWGPNLAVLPKTPPAGLSGELVDAGDGRLHNFNGRKIAGAIVLMDLDSDQNWLNAAMLGAGALIFYSSDGATRHQFEEKNTPTPLAFPRFWVPAATAVALRAAAAKAATAVVQSDTHWEHGSARNIFAVIEGTNPDLAEEAVLLEAPYDAASPVLGLAPGADQATSIAMLLHLAEVLAAHPPERSVLFAATAGSGQGLAGMREFIWSATGRRKDLAREQRYVRDRRAELKALRDLLMRSDPLALESAEDQDRVWNFVVERAKDAADTWGRRLQDEGAVKARADGGGGNRSQAATGDASQLRARDNPRAYRRLSWRLGVAELDDAERELARDLIRQGLPGLRAELGELKERQQVNRDAIQVKRLMGRFTPVLVLSLSLSSAALESGIVEWSQTFPLQQRVTRPLRAFRLGEQIKQIGAGAAAELGLPNLIRDSARGARGGIDVGATPVGLALASDVAAIAGLPAVSLVTLDHQRLTWGTPADRLERVNLQNLQTLARFLPAVLSRLCSQPATSAGCIGAVEGLAGIRGQAMFIRQGELFADQPAPNTIISAIQGKSIFRTMAFRDGSFLLTGIANRRVALEKVILEPYGIDPASGRVAWTADKVQTGKDNYRLKIKSRVGSAPLVMFHCRQTDVIGVFDPQQLDHLTKVQVLDGVTEARPLRYWYSRVDGRDTMAISLFLEPGSRFKLVLSDTLLRPELVLLNGSARDPQGTGLPIGEPALTPTPLQVTRDLHHLLGRRVDNLAQKGIVNRYLEDLYRDSSAGLAAAEQALAEARYDQFWSSIVGAWSQLNRIYTEVEGTQRDVLTGVMFFIALFVPFAYCMERYLFCFRGIYQQVSAFFLILLATIFTIRALHPAFQLTYNPMVVIVAFFIVGLSLTVAWIIFVRFEQEMANSRKNHELLQAQAEQANKWQAFGAGFAIGASNLNRRKGRTALTCLTLIILTFTVMSFTNVKSLQQTSLTRIGEATAYRGILIRHQLWRPLTALTLEALRSRFSATARVWPRGWLRPEDPLDRSVATIGVGNRTLALEGLLGLGPEPPEPFRRLIRHGRWFEPGEARAVILPIQAAAELGLVPERDLGVEVRLGGEPFQVVGFFDGDQLETLTDLDGQRVTPAYLEISADAELSEVEVEAIQSGEDIQPMTERFRFARADLTVIVPYRTGLGLGGELTAISILPEAGASPIAIADDLARWLAYPLFVGEAGTWYHSAARTLRYQGVANLLVPILIVVFICLNTMIGHVHERQKEISVYTSVGLAPAHVGFLFIVEAMALAVLATVIGYILAQVSARYMGQSAMFSDLTFNYSSLASIACMFLVFSVVFTASLYPARIAARLAMPDVTRTWRLPEPEGDLLTLNLPFLLKNEEEMGIMRFLAAFIESHQDVAHGNFIVSGTNLDLESPPGSAGRMPAAACLVLRADVWLAPFDFGIKQRVQLHCCPSEAEPGYLEIAIRMIRLAGESSSWVRSNASFIKTLRKQMLLWRLLGTEAKARYAGPEAAEPEAAASATASAPAPAGPTA